MANPYIIVPLVTWVVSQLLKFALLSWREDLSWRHVLRVGGMPSAATAITASLIITLVIEEGSSSRLVAAGLALALLMVFDVIVARRTENQLEKLKKDLKARLSHLRDSEALDTIMSQQKVVSRSPADILAGAGLGVFLAVILNYERMVENGWGANQIPQDSEQAVYVIISISLIAVSIFGLFLLRRGRHSRLPTGRRLARVLRTGLFIPGLLGLLFYGAQEQSILLARHRLWTVLAFVWTISVIIYSLLYILPGSLQKMTEELDHFHHNKITAKKRAKKARRSKRRKRH